MSDDAPHPELSATQASHVSPIAITSDDERNWIYPEPSRGRFWTARLVVGWLLIALFTALPWIEIGGQPAILLDVISRRFVIFGAVFHATDTFYLTLLGLSALSFIGLLTAVLGRVWCGWGCPQTVYLEFVFRPIERLVEGS
ncbi:MAG: 4Fe-4S binding protein, partial [Bradymonadaceae bacterium]